MLARAGVAGGADAARRRDLRGWHYVLTGGVLASLSPYGFDTGMTGRYWSSATRGECAAALGGSGWSSARPGPRPRRGAAARPLQPDPRRCGGRGARAAGDRFLDPASPAERNLVVAYDLNVPARTPLRPCGGAPRGRSCSSGRRAGPIRRALPPTSAGCSGSTSWRPGTGSGSASTTATSARGPPTTGRRRSSPPSSPAPRRNRTRATATRRPTLTTGCAVFLRAVADESARERDGGWLGGIREWVPNSGPVPSSRLA